jgi:hypothetical protein
LYTFFFDEKGAEPFSNEMIHMWFG